MDSDSSSVSKVKLLLCFTAAFRRCFSKSRLDRAFIGLSQLDLLLVNTIHLFNRWLMPGIRLRSAAECRTCCIPCRYRQLITWPNQSIRAEQQATLQLGLQEVLVNAVRHGNGNDPLKCVRIRRILSPRWCVFQVQDEGPGLPAQARVSALPDRLDSASGRGLFLIHQCFEDVRWSRRGNRVQVAIRRA